MNRRLATRIGVAVLVLASAQIVAANVPIQVTYTSVDSVEIKNEELCTGCRTTAVVMVRGIPAGSGTPVTFSFNFGLNNEMATRCESLATIAMAKPGKYQFGIGAMDDSGGGSGHCHLTLVSP